MKKLLLIPIFIGLISFSVDIIGPRYRIESSLGTLSGREKYIFRSYKFFSSSISLFTEWKAEINQKLDITFGPKITGNVAVNFDNPSQPTIRPSILLGGEVDFNYKIKENIKVYTGIEVGTGIGFQVPIISGDKHIQGPEFTSISKFALGIKLKDRYNIAIYTGDINGMIGIELGYTF
ncbi:hypothetical protein CEP89_02160 [Streptobacillus moniliformis]|uniref:Outer membrane protein beta-barrel domain-containing protein n=1 Tax=Streptobacillus moniliformis (strain ATCC 14647 / DSM 12112 / NCTC 10651 / 9901) TaxID=519441 RepID=D1AX64_STRM9|nr:hypothetical protein [Streptobacillus moniliformis]ACZ00890.1 hypothetical protein Smon_0408 [Streptobacillus moniliformis DSM 12112]AVL42722.1 hypothetical protein CEP89_02160 [Streptobacillus moniliformis]SQA13972.1 Uncharacterised protein [Streptobacillus moniliformis]